VGYKDKGRDTGPEAVNAAYRETVALLHRMPATFGIAALRDKGGTALNLFVHDMPRLSVDIDVAYTIERCRAPKHCKISLKTCESSRRS